MSHWWAGGVLPLPLSRHRIGVGRLLPVLGQLWLTLVSVLAQTLASTDAHYNFFESLISGRDVHSNLAPSDRFRKMFPAQARRCYTLDVASHTQSISA